jgi:hypothetical protein
MIIEKVAKILDYFNKEKIVRIILLLFDVLIFHFNNISSFRTLKIMKSV